MSFIYSLLHAKYFPPADPVTSFSGKTVLVTGANCGLGFEAALKFTSLGASTVILACRSISRAEVAACDIEGRTGRTGIIKVFEVDMCSYDSVKALAERVENEVPQLDVAVLNAGVVQMHHSTSCEGWEKTLQVNVLSTALLGMLLLPKLQRSAAATAKEADNLLNQPSRLCFVSSGNYEYADLSLSARQSPSLLGYYSGAEGFAGAENQYNISKLFLMYAVNELVARSEQYDRVIINTVNPGATATSLTRSIDSFPLKMLAFVYLRLLARTAEQGSRSLVSGCLVGREGMGRLWAHDRFERLAPIVDSSAGMDLQRRVWLDIVKELKKCSKLVERFE